MDRSQAASSNFMDIHDRLVADILTRYRALIMLATGHGEEDRHDNNPETVMVTGISMKMEFDALYSSIKELLTLSRRIKELWVFGPLGKGDPEREEKEQQINQDVGEVARLLNEMEKVNMTELAGKHGGTWEPLVIGDGDVLVSAPAPTAAVTATATVAAQAASAQVGKEAVYTAAAATTAQPDQDAEKGI